MARIRSVKPELFRHEGLFEAEMDYQLPLRFAFIGLFTCCDREGRFKWRPQHLKLDIFPYDNIDIVRVLEALVERGFVRKYEYQGTWYGCIPTWLKHQRIDHHEMQSVIPDPVYSLNDSAKANVQSNLGTAVPVRVEACLQRQTSVPPINDPSRPEACNNALLISSLKPQTLCEQAHTSNEVKRDDLVVQSGSLSALSTHPIDNENGINESQALNATSFKAIASLREALQTTLSLLMNEEKLLLEQPPFLPPQPSEDCETQQDTAQPTAESLCPNNQNPNTNNTLDVDSASVELNFLQSEAPMPGNAQACLGMPGGNMEYGKEYGIGSMEFGIGKGNMESNNTIVASKMRPRLPQEPIQQIFEHWKTVMRHPNAKLDPKRKALISKALRLGYGIEQLCHAITGRSMTPHNMGDNDRGQRYDGLHVILRDADQIDRFIHHYSHPPKPVRENDRRTQANVHTLQRWMNRKMREEQSYANA